MALPRAVKKQVDEAAALMEQLQSGEDEGQQEAEPKEPAVKAEQQVEPEQVEPEQVEPEVQQEPDSFKHKYDVLKGKYDKEVPTLHGQVRDLQGRLQHMEELLGNLQQKKEDTDDVAPSAKRTVAHITEDEVEEYGEDLIDVMRRAAREAVADEISALRQEMGNITQQVGGVTQVVTESKRDKIFAKLDEKIENWRDVNRSEPFLAWLNERDPYSGNQRGVMLRRAFDEGDTSRVIAFFTGFQNEHAAVSSSAPTGSQKGKPGMDANKLVAPGKPRASTGSAGAQDDKRTYTEQEINDFYKAVGAGQYRKKPDEKNRKEAEIFRALKEGRVVPTNQVPVSNAAY